LNKGFRQVESFFPITAAQTRIQLFSRQLDHRFFILLPVGLRASHLLEGGLFQGVSRESRRSSCIERTQDGGGASLGESTADGLEIEVASRQSRGGVMTRAGETAMGDALRPWFEMETACAAPVPVMHRFFDGDVETAREIRRGRPQI
jgi:hypothetical protein